MIDKASFTASGTGASRVFPNVTTLTPAEYVRAWKSGANYSDDDLEDRVHRYMSRGTKNRAHRAAYLDGNTYGDDMTPYDALTRQWYSLSRGWGKTIEFTAEQEARYLEFEGKLLKAVA